MRHDGLDLVRPATRRRDNEPGRNRRTSEPVDAQGGKPAKYRFWWCGGQSDGVALGIRQRPIVGDDDPARHALPATRLDPVADRLAAELRICGTDG
jgi:hypothetical protein